MFHYLCKDFSFRRANIVFDSSGKMINNNVRIDWSTNCLFCNFIKECDDLMKQDKSKQSDPSAKLESAAVPWAKLLRHPAFWYSFSILIFVEVSIFTKQKWLISPLLGPLPLPNIVERMPISQCSVGFLPTFPTIFPKPNLTFITLCRAQQLCSLLFCRRYSLENF